MHFSLEIITPETVIINKPVVMAVLPGSDGELGILADHAPLIAALGDGKVNLYADNDKAISESITISGGFVEMIDNKCVVLAESATVTA